jgi:hypothetical protein
MSNDNLNAFAAHTQARITFTLIGGFLGLMFALLIIACLPLKADDKLLAILDRIITALLPIVGTAVGFWMARQRHQGVPEDSDTNLPTAVRRTTISETLPAPKSTPESPATQSEK